MESEEKQEKVTSTVIGKEAIIIESEEKKEIEKNDDISE